MDKTQKITLQQKDYKDLQNNLWIRIAKGTITLEEANTILEKYKRDN